MGSRLYKYLEPQSKSKGIYQFLSKLIIKILFSFAKATSPLPELI